MAETVIRMRPKKKTIYLAGPDVFLPDAIDVGERKKALCREHGFVGVFPFDNEINSVPADEREDHFVYRANLAMIRAADAGIFNLTPFRGVSADPGTVFELGVMIGLGKPAFGYSNESEDLLARTRQADLLTLDDGVWRDQNRMKVEDFGNADNLMIDASLAVGGHPIVRRTVQRSERYRDLSGFEECLRMAREAFGLARPLEAPKVRRRAS
jgi:nucleoside 2-deoxyribosyltransferase